MLGAGVFGTVVGDVTSHWIGEGSASLLLGALLTVVLQLRNRFAASLWAAYWLTVAVARTAGTAIGDFLAESKSLAIGLPIATAISGTIFVGLLILWRSARPVGEPR